MVRSDDGPVELLLGDDGNNIEGQVTRYFSRHYQKRLPRIVGGEKLREWFQAEYQVNNHIAIDFISFEEIHFPGNPLSKELRQKAVSNLIEMFLNFILERDWLDDTTVIPALRREIVRRGEFAVNPLLVLLTHSDWAVRDDVARMLGYIGDIRAVDALLVAMMKDENETVQKSAAEALLRIGTPKAVALVNTYQNFLRENKENG